MRPSRPSPSTPRTRSRRTAALGRLAGALLVVLAGYAIGSAGGCGEPPGGDDAASPAPQRATSLPAVKDEALEAGPLWLSADDCWAFEPTAALDADGILWVVWLAWRRDESGVERVDLEYARLIGDRVLGRGTIASDLRAPAAPHLVAWRAGVYGVLEGGDEGARSLHGFTLVVGPTEVLVSALETVAPPGPARLEPRLASDGERELQIVWQELVGTTYDLHWARRGEDGWGAERPLVASDLDEWRPRAVMAPDGTLHVVYDVFRDGSFDVDWLLARDGEVVEHRTLAGGPDHQAWPDLALAPDGTPWVAWEAGAQFGETGPLRGWSSNVLRIAALYGGAPAFVRDPLLVSGDRRLELPRLAVDRNGPTVACRTMLREPPVDAREGREWLWVVGRTALIRFGEGGVPRSTTLPESDGDNAATETLVPDGLGGLWVVLAGDLRSEHFAERRKWNDSLESRWRVGLVHARGSTATPELDPAAPLALRHVAPRPEPFATAAPADDRGPRVFYGDLHRHTHLSRCAGAADGTPADAYRYARGPGALDFVAITDHCQHLSPFSWWRSVRDVERYSAPGSLVTFAALEKLVGGRGHFNAIFPDLARTQEDLVPKLWKELEPETDVLLIPHMMGGDTLNRFVWDEYVEDKMRLLEVFQGYRGSFEGPGAPYESPDRQFQGAALSVGLDAGHHFGLIASSDHSSSGTSFAGVRATAFERDALYAALMRRETFASTTRADVDAALGALRMGEAGWSGAGPTPLRIRARGPAPVASVEVLKNGRPFARRGGEGTRELFVLSLGPRPEDDLEPLRVRAVGGSIGGHRVRVATARAPHIELDAAGTLACWRVARARTDLVLEVDWTGPETERAIELVQGEQRVLVDLTDLAVGEAVRLREEPIASAPSTAGGLWRIGAPLDLDAVDLEFPDPERERGDSYYVRIAWTDGNLAWTSPILVLGESEER